MLHTPQAPSPAFVTGYEMRLQSLYHEGRGLSFPCSAQGEVDLDSLSPQALDNYLFARATVGREYASPAVLAH